jgi:hypothetical protein
MAYYRLYCLDGAGKISLTDKIEAGDDAQAIVIARDTHRHSGMCEIWQRNRLVATLDATCQPDRSVSLSRRLRPALASRDVPLLSAGLGSLVARATQPGYL